MSDITIITGDSRRALRTLPDNSAQACVTSPPAWWQRDYGHPDQIGHEETIGDCVAALIGVFREVRRVLRPAGVCFANLGDTYYSGTGRSTRPDPRCPSRDWMRRKPRPVDQPGWDIPRKSLLMIPARVALALQADGWTLRQEIVWHRRTALPEPSAKDRPHRRHEPLFLLSKRGSYHFDRAALPPGEESVWQIPHRRNGHNGGHAAAYPLELAERCIATATRPGDLVLDPFLGTGTTAVSAKRTGRRCVGIEINETFAALARRTVEAGRVVAADRRAGPPPPVTIGHSPPGE